MNQKLSPQQLALHEKALYISREHRRLEGNVIEILQQVDDSKLYKKLGFSSLFKYTVESLGFTEAVAYSFITVMRKTLQIKDLKTAIETQKLSVAKASRFSSILNIENAQELISFAQSHTTREVDFKVATLQPKSLLREHAKPISEQTVEIRFNLTKETYEKLKRAETLTSNKSQPWGLAGTIEILIENYLERHDPVVKARRALARKKRAPITDKQKILCANKVPLSTNLTTSAPELAQHSTSTPDYNITPRPSPRSKGRVRLNAHHKHRVFERDGGRCTFKDSTGKRCANEKWLHLHHIKSVHTGGSNEPHNITTLCSFHHDLVHQLSLPIDGQSNWLRSPSRTYKVKHLKWTSVIK